MTKKKTGQKRTVPICLRIDLATKQQLSRMAEADMRTLNSLIYKIVKEYVDRLDRADEATR
jgi:hypothetical protein